MQLNAFIHPWTSPRLRTLPCLRNLSRKHQRSGESAWGPDIEEGKATSSAPSWHKCDVISRWQFACVISLCVITWNYLTCLAVLFLRGGAKRRKVMIEEDFSRFTCQRGLKTFPEHTVMMILPEPWIYSHYWGKYHRGGEGIRYSRDIISQRGSDKLSKLNLSRFLQNKNVQMTELLADRLRHFCGLHSYFLFPLRKVSEALLVNGALTDLLWLGQKRRLARLNDSQPPAATTPPQALRSVWEGQAGEKQHL